MATWDLTSQRFHTEDQSYEWQAGSVQKALGTESFLSRREPGLVPLLMEHNQSHIQDVVRKTIFSEKPISGDKRKKRLAHNIYLQIKHQEQPVKLARLEVPYCPFNFSFATQDGVIIETTIAPLKRRNIAFLLTKFNNRDPKSHRSIKQFLQ